MVALKFSKKEGRISMRFFLNQTMQIRNKRKAGAGVPIFSAGVGKHSWLALRASRARYACILGWLRSRTPRMIWCKPPTLKPMRSKLKRGLYKTFVFVMFNRPGESIMFGFAWETSVVGPPGQLAGDCLQLLLAVLPYPTDDVVQTWLIRHFVFLTGDKVR